MSLSRPYEDGRVFEREVWMGRVGETAADGSEGGDELAKLSSSLVDSRPPSPTLP